MIKSILSCLAFLISLSLYSQSKPTPFLPELFKNYPNVRDIAIAPDGNEIYFTVDDLKSKVALITYIQKNKGGWSGPKTVSFTGNYRDIEPAFSLDGKRLFFVSNRPVHKDSIKPKDYDIWYVDRIGNIWSKPKNLGAPINTKGNEFYPSLTKHGDLYFTAEREGAVGREDIFVSRLKKGVYNEPIAIKGGVNTAYFEFNAFVAPDERYLIFSGQRPKEGKGRGDLYISYNENDVWSKATLLGKVNSEYLDFCPFVDMTSGIFYFTSQKTDVKRYYEKPLDIRSFLKLYGTTPKGLNRLYSIDLKELINND